MASFSDSSTGFTLATIGIQATDRAAVVIDGNRIVDNTEAAAVYGGLSSGRFMGRTAGTVSRALCSRL